MDTLETLGALAQFVLNVVGLAVVAVVSIAALIGAWRAGKWLVHRYAVGMRS